nr:hypothetical protein [Limimaricola cinnabarinus]
MQSLGAGGFGHLHNHHAGGLSSLGAGVAVLEDDATGGVGAEAPGGFEIGVGGGLGVVDVVHRDDGVDMRVETRRTDLAQPRCAARRGGDRHWQAQPGDLRDQRLGPGLERQPRREARVDPRVPVLEETFGVERLVDVVADQLDPARVMHAREAFEKAGIDLDALRAERLQRLGVAQGFGVDQRAVEVEDHGVIAAGHRGVLVLAGPP